MNYTQKEFLNIRKGIWYNLFSRKLSFITLKGDKEQRNVFLFSNVDPEDMRIYDDSSKYGFAKVTIKDEKFIEDFYSRFPIIESLPCVINVVDFIATLTKNKDIDGIELTTDGSYLFFPAPIEGNSEIKPAGEIVSKVETSMYFNIWKSGLIDKEISYTLKVDKDDLLDRDYKVFEVRDTPEMEMSTQKALAIIQPGINFVTLNSYCKNMKSEPTFGFLICGSDKNSIILNYKYSSDIIDVVGTHPAQHWFVNRK